MMEKYSWNFDRDAERWGNDTHNTIGKCLVDARKAIADGEEEPTSTVYIGENIEFVPCVDAESVLDQLEEDAAEFGEVGEDWEAYEPKMHVALDELSETLSQAVRAWLKKYGREPEFWRIENIKSYPLNRPEEAQP